MLRSSKSAASAKQAPDDSEKVPNVEDTGSSPIAIDTMFSVREVWKTLEDAGEQLTQASKLSLFFRAVTAGIFIGFGGILTLSVGFDMGSPPWESGNGFARFMSGAIGFPLTILLVSITGQGAWTGDALLVAVAYWRKRCSLACVIRLLIITYIGCFVSTLAMGAFAVGADLPAVKPCQLLAAHKMHLTPLQLLLRGMGGGCLICLSIFLSKSARSMPGKVMAIWFCISTYVICDYEHCLVRTYTYCSIVLFHV